MSNSSQSKEPICSSNLCRRVIPPSEIPHYIYIGKNALKTTTYILCGRCWNTFNKWTEDNLTQYDNLDLSAAMEPLTPQQKAKEALENLKKKVEEAKKKDKEKTLEKAIKSLADYADSKAKNVKGQYKSFESVGIKEYFEKIGVKDYQQSIFPSSPYFDITASGYASFQLEPPDKILLSPEDGTIPSSFNPSDFKIETSEDIEIGDIIMKDSKGKIHKITLKEQMELPAPKYIPLGGLQEQKAKKVLDELIDYASYHSWTDKNKKY